MEAYIPDSDHRKQAVVDFFAANGQQFLPVLELLMDAKEQLTAFTHTVGIAAIEGLLELSATQLAGEKHPGKAAVVPAGTSLLIVQRTEKFSAGTPGAGGLSPQSKSMYSSSCTTTGSPWSSGLPSP